ncbi:MAG: ABC transporter ATP-binding protein [Suilimivivens sp.]
MVRNNLFWKTGLKFGYLLFAYVIAAILLNRIIIQGNDLIADAVDYVLNDRVIQMRNFLCSLLSMTVTGTIVSCIKSLSQNYYSANVQREVRETLAEHMVKMPPWYFDEKGTGSIITKMVSDVGEVGKFFSEILPEFLLNLITVVMVTGYLIQMDAMLILILLTSYPVMLLAADKMSKKAAEIVKTFRTKMDDRTQIAYDAVQGMIVGRSYNLYGVLKRRIDTVIDETAVQACKSTRISSLGWVTKDVLTTIPVILCYLYALYEVMQGRLTAGEMLAFTVLMGRIIYPVGDLVFCLNDFRTARVALKRLQNIYLVEEEGVHRTDLEKIYQKPKENVPAVLWENVCFSYQEEREVLKGISFEIHQGETVAFVGGSGEGKSTVFRLLLGFYQKSAGSYYLFGRKFEEWHLGALRDCFSYVSQTVFLLPGSIFDNVSCGKEKASAEEVKAACKAANIHEFIEMLPDGYNTVIGERGVRLSGGERQRLSIARAFLKDAPVILLDEPTASVDVATEAEIQTAIAKITQGKTVLVIAHRLSTVIHADRIYVLHNGRITESGIHSELIKQEGIYADLYGKEVAADASSA